MTNMEKLLEQLKGEYQRAANRREGYLDVGDFVGANMVDGEIVAFKQAIMLVKGWIDCETSCAAAGDVLEASEGKHTDPALERAREGVEKLEQAKRAVNRLEKRNPDFL